MRCSCRLQYHHCLVQPREGALHHRLAGREAHSDICDDSHNPAPVFCPSFNSRLGQGRVLRLIHVVALFGCAKTFWARDYYKMRTKGGQTHFDTPRVFAILPVPSLPARLTEVLPRCPRTIRLPKTSLSYLLRTLEIVTTSKAQDTYRRWLRKTPVSLVSRRCVSDIGYSQVASNLSRTSCSFFYRPRLRCRRCKDLDAVHVGSLRWTCDKREAPR